MSKRGKNFVVIIAMVIQMMLGVLYGFSKVPVPAWGCFVIWCACTAMIYRFIGAPEVV